MKNWLAQGLYIVFSVGLALYGWLSWIDALPQYKNESLTIPTVLLYAVTLPGSFVVQALFTALSLVFPVDRFDMGSGLLNWMIKAWGPLTVVGYLQWFVLVPRLFSYWRSRSPTPSD